MITLKFSKYKLGCCLVTLLYFHPADYIMGSFLSNMTKYLLIILMIFFLVIALIQEKRDKYKPCSTLYYLILWFFWVLIGSTLINFLIGNRVSWSEAIRYFSVAIGYMLFVDINLCQRPKDFLQCFVFVGTIICSINAVTMFLYYESGGMARDLDLNARYFLALDNATYYWTWIVLVVNWIYYYMYSRNKKTFFIFFCYTVLTLASYIKTWSVTPIIANFFFALVFLIYRKRMEKRKKSKQYFYKTMGIHKFDVYWILALLFNYLMAIYNISMHFGEFIVKYFHKSISMSGRTRIWENSMIYIKQAMIIGYGQEDRNITISRININHTHNILLENLYRGGLIAIGIFVAMLMHIGKKSSTVSNTVYDFLMIATFIFLCVSVSDFAFYRYTYLILFLLLDHIELFISKS